jgi:hypothetical protein
VVLASGITTTSYIVSGLVEGKTYAFTVAARNSLGYSAESTPPVSILVATVPGQVPCPTV